MPCRFVWVFKSHGFIKPQKIVSDFRKLIKGSCSIGNYQGKSGMARSQQPKPAPPASAADAVPHIRKFMIGLFDREDGEAADWKLITNALFKTAFILLDGLPDAPRQAVARRVHELSYEALMKESGAGKTEVAGPVSVASNTRGLKSPSPRPPK
jgi:hypothetical protein